MSERVFERANRHHGDATRITRTIETDLELGELWSLVADGGRVGRVDGRRRRHRRSIPAHMARSSTMVSLATSASTASTPPAAWPSRGGRTPGRTRPRPSSWWSSRRHTGSRLRVTETRASAGASSLAWDVRAMLLVTRRRRASGVTARDRPACERATASRSTSCSPCSPTRRGGRCSSTSSTTGRRRRPSWRPTSPPRARRSSSTCGSSPTPRSSIAERTGREVHYRATTERLADAVTWLIGASASWDRRTDRLRARR